MTIQTTFYDWGNSPLSPLVPPYESISPNLRELATYLIGTVGGQHLGLDDWNRPIRDGQKWSDHAYGAAVDWRYGPNWLPNTTPVEVQRATITDVVLPWLIDWSAELGVDAIHDYVGDRIWRAGRTKNLADAHTLWWRKQNGAGSGMGESWARYLHVATSFASFGRATPITERGIPGVLDKPPQPTPEPTPQPEPEPPTVEEDDPMFIARNHAGQYAVGDSVRKAVYTESDVAFALARAERAGRPLIDEATGQAVTWTAWRANKALVSPVSDSQFRTLGTG